jgi:D-alanyl-D-alanine carboxypeptidase (penicillin-binding protein 5/6)
LTTSLAGSVAPATKPSLPWTDSGESAISLAGGETLGSGPEADKASPIASITKLITIMTVLKKYPLTAGADGPTITLTQADQNLYNKYVAENGSSVPVAAGEQLTEYQMLQAMLLPSANNVADSLANWAYGSFSAYKASAQAEVKSLGMTKTTIGSDASGFSPDTTSTAHDLLILGNAADAQPAIKTIAKTAQLNDFPDVGTVYNTNALLGTDGVTGLKTGTSDEAGSCLLFTATHKFDNGQTKDFVGVVMNAVNDNARFSDSKSLLEATYSGFTTVTAATKGQTIGHVTSAWGQHADIVPTADLTEFIWSGDAPAIPGKITLAGATKVSSNQTVGTATVDGRSVPLVTTAAITPPSFWWRLLH